MYFGTFSSVQTLKLLKREREGGWSSPFISFPVVVGVAKLLLQYGANINTHSNEFKESALTLACYKGHLEMVKFLLSAGMLIVHS